MYRFVVLGSLTLANAYVPAARAQEALMDNPLVAPDGLQPVLTPTRLKQAPRDVPASVTVLSADMLAAYGFVGVGEAIRVVAGGGPQRLGGANYDLKVGKRSSSGPPHMTLLIDGVEIGGTALSDDDEWADLPVSIDDVERIEVTRGPGTAGYGYAVTMVIVNIVTKHPADIERGYGRVTYGAYDTLRVLGRAGMTLGPGAVRLTLHHRQRGEITDDRAGTARPDPLTLDRFTVRSAFDLDDASNLAIDAAYLIGEREGDERLAPPLGRQTLRSGYASVNWSRSLDASNELHVRLDQWANTQDTAAVGCGAGLDDAWAASGAVSGLAWAMPEAKPPKDCTPASLGYQRRMRLEVQDVHVFGNGVRVLGGVGWRQEQASLRNADQLHWSTAFRRAFVAAEWEIVPDVDVNLGASSDDGAAANYDRSVRAGVNWRLSPDQTLRAAWSMGDWASDKGRRLGLGGTDNVVTQERMQAWDLGYLLTLPDRSATVEARVYWTRLKGRVWNAKQPAQPEQPARGEVYGGEARASGNFTDRWSGFVGASTLIEGSNTGEAVAGPRPHPWSAAIGTSLEFGEGWRASAAYYGSTRLNTATQSAGRADLVLMKEFRWNEARGRALATYRRADHLRLVAPDGTPLSQNGSADTYFLSFQLAY
ncbi:TonB-dependent receptor plug domain-containing protein [Ideonella sp. YS5]|uniref:TonB-dependent receptor plug domain-containing protein n=1 Tax=Ideonella sp. YS5 TaxID=3453714 RepID=UPI003EEC9532